MNRHKMDKESISKAWSISMVLVLILSSLLVSFIFLDDTQSAEAEPPSTPIGTITGAIDDRYFGWNVSTAGDINDDGYDDVIVGAPYSGVVVEASDWWNDNWTYRRRLSFDNSGQNENLTNFPVLVNLNSTNFDYDKVNLDASDLRFIDGDGVTELAYHIEEWNSFGDSYIWVNVTEIDGNSNSDYMWIYYNNAAASDAQDVNGTYDADYVGVWHLNDSVGPVGDSTANGHDGTALGGVDRGFTGMVDGAYDFEGDDDYMDFGNDPQLMVTGDITLEAWVNIDTDPATYDYAIMQLGDSGEAEAENWLYLLVLTPGATGLDVDIGHEYGGGIDEKRTYTTNLQLDTWHYLVATRDVSVNEWRLFIDGVQFDTPFVYGNGPTGGSLGSLMVCMDWFNLAWRYTDGTMDELRISGSPRSADWILAQYLSMTNDFITFGDEEIINGTCGAAYVFFGGPGIMGDISVGNADITINGTSLNARFGWSVAAGDVVGDNTTDILVGAPGYDGGQNIGAVYIFDGDTLTSDADGRLVASEATTMITGENPGDEFGSAISGAGDVNNDGYDDLIIGAPEYGASKGRAYIFFADGSIPTAASDADVFLAAVSDDSRFGHSVSSAGDMNGDGNFDVIVGALGENKAYIYFGGPNMTTTRLSKPLTQGAQDTAGGNIADLFFDDDIYLTVPKNGKIMFLDSFNITGLAGKVTSATLYVQYYTQKDYGTNDNITWALDGGPLQDTDIMITQSATEVTPPGYDLFTQGVDTIEKLETLDISFTNTDTGGQRNVFFDYVWIEVMTNAAEPMLVLDDSGGFGWSLSNGGDVNGDDLGDVIIGAPDLSGSTSGKAFIKYGNFQGFDNEATGVTPVGWQQIGLGTNDALVSENASYGSSGKSIEFNWTGGDLAEIRKVFPSAQQGDKGVVEFCVRVSEIDNVKFYILMGNTTSGNWTSRLAFGSAIAGEEDYIRYYEGNGDGTGMYYPLQPYTVDTWYHIRILSDSTTNTWDLYIDGVLKVEDIGFVSDNTIPNYISFHQFNAGNPHVDYVDNVVWLFNNPEVMITGDSNGDQFGYSVANAGNLNGDSFDDIIVGAPKANGNGTVYTFNGNDSWKSVISAATANNTLIGEYTSDGFGWSVSNAGDVDGNNQDDIIIGAPHYDDGANIDAGKAYIYFGPNITFQPDLWINGSIDNIYQTMPAVAQINVSLISAGNNATWWIALQNDGSENDTFDFSITTSILPGWNWEFMENGTGKVVNDGDFIYLISGDSINYTLNISSPGSAGVLDEFWVEIVAKSQNGTTYDSIKAIARIAGDFQPEISDVQAIPNPQESGGSVNITCNVTDDIGVLEVWVNITYLSGGYDNQSMFNGVADEWFYKNMYTVLDLYQFTIWANDTSGNWNSSSGHSFTIQDTTVPVISNVLEVPNPQEITGSVNISCDVNDSVGVYNVWINITFPTGGNSNFTMFPGAADQWFLNTTYVTLGLYQYTVWANDTTGNWNFSSGHSFIIQDTSLPEISDVSAIPNTLYVGGNVNLSGNITDVSGIFGAWVNITLPGGGYVNQTLIQGSGDRWFYNNTYTIPGVYQFTIWANDTAGNWNKSSSFTFEVLNRDPQLSLCQVNPLVGYNDTWFNFTVTYTDLDDHAPDKITVNITNYGVFDMMEVDASDTNYSDGKAYYLNISGFQNGTSYSFHFAANDTMGNWTESAELPGPQVLNTPPILLSPSLNPLSGSNTTYFNFTVTYFDIDNHPPDEIMLNLTGPSGGTYNLVEADPSDTDYSDGKEYYYNTTLSNGTYSNHFATKDSLSLWYETSEINAPLVGISKPILTGSGVTPASGYIDTWFNFTVNYSHPFNKGPNNTTLNLTGPSGGIFDLVEVDPSDSDYADGKLYYYNVSGLAIGSYSFHFAANDTDGNWSESGISLLDISNRPPSLTAPQVNPNVGYIDTGFNFTVIYTDLDNHAPDNITVNITNFGTFTLLELDPSDINYIDGKSYYLNLTGFLNDTSYSYHFSANDSEGVWVETIKIDGPTVYDTSPILTSPSVSPVSGFTDTWFNFTVNYTDLDNHDADDITVNITGMGYFELSELDPGDLNFADGKWYYINLTGFVNGTSYSYHFAAKNVESEWVETAETSGPIIFHSQPMLTTPSVNPISGYIDTWFNFTVNYTNIDNHAPDIISVNITNYGIINLSELDPGDLNYTDGKWYYANLTGFINGTSYSYHFAANDSGGLWVETIETGGPFIYNSQPMLTSPSVSPLVGYIDTGFNFTVIYTDLDDHAPDIITVNITGLGAYALLETDPSDTNYTDGKSYYINISGIPVGTFYTFHFAANDTIGDWVEGPEIDGPDVINRAPTLSLEQVNPNTGFIDTWFNFSVVYTDLDNDSPDTITVNITGIGIIDLIEVDPFDVDFTNGKTYYYNMSGIAMGLYTFHFAANDTIGNWTETGNLQFEVLNRDPTLAAEIVIPNSGFIDTWFNFTVVYTDLDNLAPETITVNISGVGVFDLIEIDPLDIDFTDGKTYYYNMSGIALSQYTFHFAANDTMGTWIESSPLQFDVVNRAPQLSGDGVDPSTGYTDTGFNFTVTYTDLDDHAPDIITVNITGLGVYTIVETDPFDTDYTDGKSYYINISGIPLGTSYTFHFAANDTMGDWVEGFEIDRPDVINRAPTLSMEQVNPNTGFLDTWFNFSVLYTDLDNNPPDIITVNITGIGVIDLIEVDPLDMDFTDGKTFYYNMSGITIGIYTFHFAANDTMGAWIESSPLQFDVVNRAPQLSGDGVDPSTGYTDTGFNFTVTYTDLDDHPPDIITVNITGLGVYALVEANSSDTNYMDGKSYYINISGVPLGTSYTFHFAANDTMGDWVEGLEIDGPDVINRAPTLSLEQVNPNSGYLDTWFNFSVVYTDLDNNPPDIITVNITGIGNINLMEVDPLDMDYNDGKEYYYNMSGITVGQYTFHFAANDTIGAWTVSATLQFEVVNRAPELSGDGVDLATGYTDTGFNFTVIYTDLDGHSPDIITVNITGLGIYNLVESDPSDADFTDGKIYYINISGIPEGTSYTFHFATNDTIGDWAIETLDIDAPDVSERIATLTSYDKTVKYSDDVILNATLFASGIPIAGENIAFFIDKNDNGSYEAAEQIGISQTLADGTVSISYPVLLAPGNYSYLAIYLGMIYSGSNSEATLVVTPKPGTITTFHKVIEERQNAMLNATLEDEDGNRLANQVIEFYVDRNQNNIREGSELVGSGETDSNGYIEVVDTTISPQLSTGSYDIRALYKGSGNYSVTEGNAILLVQNTTNTPPIINTIVPDQVKTEDSDPWELDLTSYELDIEDTGEHLKWYLTGVNTSLYTVTGMNSSDDIFTFILVKDAFGNDEVTLWLLDSSGGITSQTLWINITPVNDRPKIEAINPITVHYDAEYTYIFRNYVSDIETPKEDLILTTNKPDYTTVDGLTITFLYPYSMLDETDNVLVTVTDTDGGSSSTIVIVKVSDDWVPELVVELPDVTLYEGETISNVFDLDDYFSDPDNDALYYVTDNFNVKIYIDPVTHVVNITAPADWSGSEIVHFHALDPSQARVEDIVLITVLPINDAPSISDVPDLVVRFDQDYKFDLTPYIKDEDNEDYELILNFVDADTGLPIAGFSIDPDNNLGMIINLPEAMNGSIIQLQIRISDGLDSNFTTINITISDDFPPELIAPIPDVSFEEDTQLTNAFNISTFFFDVDDVNLFYTSGHEMINVTIDMDGSVDFSAFLNWFGSENVTFRATDGTGALAESTIIVTVIPVNDAPTIAQVPDQSGKEGKIWVLDIHELLFDIDNGLEDLVLSVDSDYVEVVGHTLIFNYPEGVEGETVTVTVSDGALTNSATFSVTVSKVETPSSGPLLLDYILWILLIPIILTALLLGFILYKRKVEAPFVDEVFLISNDGTLITHTSMRLEDEIDKDILSGMLTGIKNLISDAFAREEEGIKDESLHKLEFGERNILLEKGYNFFIAIVFSGKENKKLLTKIQDVIQRFEEKFKDVLGKWKGDMEAFEGADEVIEPLLSLEKLSEEEREQLMEARKRRKEAEESALEELQVKLMNLPSIEDMEESGDPLSIDNDINNGVL